MSTISKYNCFVLCRLYSKGRLRFKGCGDVDKFPKTHQFIIKNNEYSEYLFGIHPVNLALRLKKRRFYNIYMKDDIFNLRDSEKNTHVVEICSLANLLNIPIEPTSRYKMNQIVNFRIHQGVILECSRLPFPIFNRLHMKELMNKSAGVILLVNSRVNIDFGILLRTCVFFGVIAVLTPLGKCSLPFPIISKMSSGALELIPIYQVNNILEVIQMLKDEKCSIIGAINSQSKKCQELKVVQSCINSNTFSLKNYYNVLVLGDDYSLSDDVIALCDLLLEIPQSNKYENFENNLNQSISLGILLHFIQRSNKRFA